MQSRVFGLALVLALAAVVGFAPPAHCVEQAATLTPVIGDSDGNAIPDNTVAPGGEFYVHVQVNPADGMAGAAVTIEYDAAVFEVAETNEFQSETDLGYFVATSNTFLLVQDNRTPPGEPQSAFPSIGNKSTVMGKVLLSGAYVKQEDPSAGGGAYTGGPWTIFKVKFRVRENATVASGPYDFVLSTTSIFNPDAGWYVETTDPPDGYTPGVDPEDPVEVPPLVGAHGQGTDQWNTPELTDDFYNIAAVFQGPAQVWVDETTINGTVDYQGPQTGTLYVAAFDVADTGFQTPIGGKNYPWDTGMTSQTFTVGVPDGSYVLGAFIDNDKLSGNSGHPSDSWEAGGAYLTTIVIAGASDGTPRDFSLSDPQGGTNPEWPAWYEQWVSENGWGDIGGPNDDFDKDGFTNQQEYENGTNPTVLDCRWQTGLHVVRDDGSLAVKEAVANIGVAESAQTVPYPGMAPEQTVEFYLYSADFGQTLFTDIRAEGQTEYIWILNVNPRGNTGSPTEDYTATLSWDPATFCPAGSYKLRKGSDGKGEIVVADMRTTTSYDVAGRSDELFTITFAYTECVDLNLKAGWNLVSLPVIPDDPSVAAIFPDALAAFKFATTYQVVTSLEPGVGYWIKVPADAAYSVCGQSFDTYSVPLAPGWHLVGAVNGTYAPVTDPDPVILGMFGFSVTYQVAEQFAAGQGYWVKVSTDCEFSVGAR